MSSNPLTSSTYDDSSKTSQSVPPTPQIFTVALGKDHQHIEFTIGQLQGQVPDRPTISGYKVYFANASLVGVSGLTSNALVAALFKSSTLVASIAASSNSPQIRFNNRLYVGLDGWFFAVSYSQTGIESTPTAPIYNPSTAASANASAVPKDVGHPQADFEPIIVNNRTVLKVLVEAMPPHGGYTVYGIVMTGGTDVVWVSGARFSQDMVGNQVTINGVAYVVSAFVSDVELTLTSSAGTQSGVSYSFSSSVSSFGGFQIYIQNYLDNDPDLLSYEEGPFFAMPLGYISGTPISGTFTILPDVPPIYSVGSVDLTASSTSITPNSGDSVPTWNPAWGGVKRITVIDGTGSYFDAAVNSIQPDVSPYLVVDSAGAWTTTLGAEYAVYSWMAGSGNTTVKPHVVRLYFVSVSKAGTRRSDVLDSPYVEFPFGLSTSMSLPILPETTSVAIQGVTASLTWSLGTTQDPAISHFNIYRQRVGTYLTVAPGSRPVTPYTTVKYDAAMTPSGKYTFIDRNFDTDSTSGTYDFDATNPGVYWYYVTSVNLEGIENPNSYAGFVSVSNGGGGAGYLVSWVAGDKFRHSRVGLEMTISGTTYTIESVTDDQNLVLVNNGFPLNVTVVEYVIGAVAMVTVLQGNTGAESDPSIYRDNMWNRLYNAAFFSESGRSQANLENAFGDSYGPVWVCDDGQIPWNNWNPNYKVASSQEISGTDASDKGSNTDDFTVWETYGVGSWDFLLDGTASTGEVKLDNGATLTLSCLVLQLINKSKFLLGEDLVFHTQVRALTLSGTPTGYFRLWVVGVDAASLKIRWQKYADTVASAITLTPQRPGMVFELPTDPTDCIYHFPGGSGTGTYVSGTQLDTGIFANCNLAGVTITSGATTYTISSVGSGTIVLTTSPSSGNLGFTLNLTASYDRITFAMGLVGVLNTNLTVALKNPMVNGGKLPANFTIQMNPLDWPGGVVQATGATWGQSYFPCVLGDTKIWTAEGLKRADEIKPGDKLISHWKSRVRNSVRSVFVNEVAEIYRIILANGSMLECSSSHLLKVWHRLFIPAEKVRVGDFVMISDGYTCGFSEVTMIEVVESYVKVYNFELKRQPHTYIANGFVSHNKLLRPV